jgi:hypothetical protein
MNGLIKAEGGMPMARGGKRGMRLRFSFKLLLVVFTVVAVCVGVFAVKLNGARRQRAAVEALRAADVQVWYQYESLYAPPGDPLAPNSMNFADVAPWKISLGRRLGRDFVFDVGRVDAFRPISAELMKRIADLRGLDHLYVNVQQGFDDDAWRALLNCRQINRLTLKRDQIVAARPLEELAALKQIEFLTIDGGEIAVADAEEIAGLGELRELTLSLVSVTDESLQPLARLKKLEQFELTHRGTGKNSTSAGVEALITLPNIRRLGLGRLVSLNDDVFSKLESAPQLESLSVEGASITGAEIHRLARLPKLKELYLTGTKVDDSAMQKLSQLAQVEVLDISFTRVTDSGLKHAATMANLRKLYVSGNGITDAGVAEIARLPLLEELAIVNSDVSDAGLAHLEKSPTLVAIWTSGNPKTTAQGVSELKAALPNRNVYAN